MKIFVLNCGSSSLKYQLIDMANESLLAKGLVERIAISGSLLKHQPANGDDYVCETRIPAHSEAVRLVIEALTDPKHGVIASVDEISAVGHRVVHGGERFTASVVLNEEIIKGIEEMNDLAPLHNPPNLVGIRAMQAVLPNLPHVAVFDTAFHQTMPKKAYLYAIPYELYTKYKIRRYGFHGTSHRFVSAAAAEMMGKPIEQLKIVTCHLGNGASVAAVQYGKVVDTSMGFTPLEGLAMGTRSGDIDPAIVAFLADKENMSPKEIDSLLNKKSGVLGVSGVSSDFRDIEAEAAKGNERAAAALEIFYYRVAKYVGEYAAAMNGLDCVVFTAGLGENSSAARANICAYIQFLGLEVDTEKNKQRGLAFEFSTAGSKVKALAIPTNEELVIARDTKAAAEKL